MDIQIISDKILVQRILSDIIYIINKDRNTHNLLLAYQKVNNTIS